MAKDLLSLDAHDKEKFMLEFPDSNDLTKFSCTFHIDSDDSYWYGGVYKFNIEIPSEYPIKPPKVRLDPAHRVWHPNIEDKDGRVCLNLLKKDWKCVCSINQVFFGLYFLFYEPNGEDPLNLEAAEEMRTKPQEFIRNVKASINGRQHPTYKINFPDMRVKYQEFMQKKQQLKRELATMTGNMEAKEKANASKNTTGSN